MPQTVNGIRVPDPADPVDLPGDLTRFAEDIGDAAADVARETAIEAAAPAVAAAQEAADQARDISGIDTSDDAIDAAFKLPGGKARATLTASFGAPAIVNPETPINGAVVQVVDGVLGGGADGLMRVVDARGVPTTPRPVWAGIVHWWVNEGQDTPVHAANGDMVSQVATTELPWSPAFGVPGMVGWFSGAGLPIGALATWENRVSGGPNFAQAAAGAQPAVAAAQVNGRQALVFDGTSDRMTMPVTPYVGPVTVYAVLGTNVTDVDGTSDFYIDAKDAASTTMRFAIYRTAAERAVLARGTNVQSADAAWTPGTKLVCAVANGATSSLAFNGAALASGSLQTSLEIAEWTIGSRSDGTNFAAGWFAELLIVHGTVDAATHARIISYLSAEWGL